MQKIKVLIVFGTRPEAIKMCPLINEMKKHKDIDTKVCVTAQHRQMLDQVLEIFNVEPDYDLNIMKENQTLSAITTEVLLGMEGIFKTINPDIVLVHGDTTTSFVVALSAYYKKIPIGHVEAGLRTYDKYSPYPEEINRTLIGKLADLHFSPTMLNKKNLIKEGIKNNIFITGNTVIDSFKTTIKDNYQYKADKLKNISLENKKCVLLTAHRRENIGQPLKNICNAVIRLANEFKDLVFIYPVHLNPNVKGPVKKLLGDVEGVHLIAPIDVEDMHNLMAKSYLVMTDSGGLQEEAPSFGVPVIVLRTETERPEAVAAGTVKVVGVDEEIIYKTAKDLILHKEEYDEMARAINPYGDGHASERIIKAIKKWYNKNKF